MKRQLKKEIEKLAGEFSHGAAQAAMKDAAAELEAAYDTLVDSGKSQLEAYRQVLKDVEKMRSVLADLPKTEEEQQAEEKEKKADAWNRKVNAIHKSLESVMWVGTVILYFLLSFLTGYWHMTWLIFLAASMGSILLNIAASYLKGNPLSAQMGKWKGLMWLGITEVYFLIGFLHGGWSWTWLLFLGGALAETLLGLIGKWKA
ncbi:MAG: hypothetical protein IJ325_13410 [Clostridia bacterium]|nr:hypothetical protein [Clostridia bacterium]